MSYCMSIDLMCTSHIANRNANRRPPTVIRGTTGSAQTVTLQTKSVWRCAESWRYPSVTRGRSDHSLPAFTSTNWKPTRDCTSTPVTSSRRFYYYLCTGRTVWGMNRLGNWLSHWYYIFEDCAWTCYKPRSHSAGLRGYSPDLLPTLQTLSLELRSLWRFTE